jgi:hypothetical protein
LNKFSLQIVNYTKDKSIKSSLSEKKYRLDRFHSSFQSRLNVFKLFSSPLTSWQNKLECLPLSFFLYRLIFASKDGVQLGVLTSQDLLVDSQQFFQLLQVKSNDSKLPKIEKSLVALKEIK